MRWVVAGSAFALIAGVASLADLLPDAGPLTLCNLLPPPHCISGHLSGVQYFTGDSQAAPVWNLVLALVGPLLAVGAAFLYLRGRFIGALSVAALACVPYAVFLFDAYAVIPFQPLVAGSVLVTFIVVSIGVVKAAWPLSSAS
jgi:hypothetical protein